MSRAPTMIGITKLAHGPAMATIRARIITMPWIAMKLLYTCWLMKWSPGVMRLVRIAIARMPPTPKRPMVTQMYWTPTTLWSVVNFQ